MKLQIAGNKMKIAGAAAMSLVLLASAGGQATRENGVPAPANSQEVNKGMLVRISEIQINPEHLDEYKAILKEEAAASVKLEPGVVSIYPMSKRDDATEIRILEIYANRQAYETHLRTPHFQKYKTTTLKMVKLLKLVDMDVMDPETMRRIFKKM